MCSAPSLLCMHIRGGATHACYGRYLPIATLSASRQVRPVRTSSASFARFCERSLSLICLVHLQHSNYINNTYNSSCDSIHHTHTQGITQQHNTSRYIVKYKKQTILHPHLAVHTLAKVQHTPGALHRHCLAVRAHAELLAQRPCVGEHHCGLVAVTLALPEGQQASHNHGQHVHGQRAEARAARAVGGALAGEEEHAAH